MNDLVVWCFLLFAVAFGYIFKDVIGWIGLKLGKEDAKNIILFFPAFLFLIAFWLQPFFSKGEMAAIDITQIGKFNNGVFLWIAVALFVGSGIRLLFDMFYNKQQ